METAELAGRDLTSGSIHRNIWYLAIPMMLESGIQNVSQLLDTYWVGQLGSAALATVTLSVTIRWVLNSLANGLGVGGMAIVARRVGERDDLSTQHAVWQNILLGIGVSVGISILGVALARPLLVLLGAEADVLRLGLSYLHVVMGGMFALVLVFIVNSLLRGAGEARLAMTVLLVCTAVNVILEPLLIWGWGPFPSLGVVGSAWANVLGFSVGLCVQAVILLRGRARVAINMHDLAPDPRLMGNIILIALPSTAQMILRSSSRLVIVGLVGMFGTFALAGYGVANRMLLILLIPLFGLGNAASTLVGQNLGASKPERAERNAWWVAVYAVGIMAVTATFLFAYARPIIAFFDATPQVIAIGGEAIRFIAPTLVFSALGVVLGGAFSGAGDTLPAMIINLATLWGLEVALAYALVHLAGQGLTGIWWGRAAANVANGVIFAIWFRAGKWKQRRV